MLHLIKLQIWVAWVITKILMCHMPSFEEKKILYLFSMGVFYTLIKGCKKKCFHKTSKFCFFGDQESPKQQNYYKNWHYYVIEKSLCPPCATVRQIRVQYHLRQALIGQDTLTLERMSKPRFWSIWKIKQAEKLLRHLGLLLWLKTNIIPIKSCNLNNRRWVNYSSKKSA